MARLSSANPPSSIPDPTPINLSRLLSRLNQTLNSHDPSIETKLRTSSLERERVGSNLEYAKELLLKLEQQALDIKAQNKKQELQTDLVKKREAVQRLRERFEEIKDLAEPDIEDDSSEEDLLAIDTPSEETDDQNSQAEPRSPTDAEPPTPPPNEPEPEIQSPIPETPAFPDPEPSSTLRSRQNPRAELFSSTTTGLSTATTEALLTHNRTEQESLTDSLLNMASALKESSKAFAFTLESEKGTLDRAVEGLDKNELGLEAASRRMGYLRTMTEGRGWWGRMMMYAWIAGLMVIAILLVFAGPKLRF